MIFVIFRYNPIGGGESADVVGSRKDDVMAQEKIGDIGRRLLCRVMQRILESGGSMPFSVLRRELEDDLGKGFDIPADFRGHYDSNPRDPKWIVAIHSQAHRFDRAGFLKRESGVWSVTPEGEDALSKGDGFINKRKKPKEKIGKLAGKLADEDARIAKDAEKIAAKANLDDREGTERNDIRNHILSKSADSQYGESLAAALLRALGYEAEQTQQSRDGGVDVIATIGELRVSRIFVQVKNQQQPVGEKPMRELAGVLTDKSDTDAGLFISFSGFLPGPEGFAKRSNKQIELMDGFRFIDLWCKHYDKLSDKDKALLPLKPIYFLDREQLTTDTPEE